MTKTDNVVEWVEKPKSQGKRFVRAALLVILLSVVVVGTIQGVIYGGVWVAKHNPELLIALGVGGVLSLIVWACRGD